MKILITGVAGFIGSNLAKKLIAEGHCVVGIDDLSYGVIEQVPSEVEFYKLDVSSKKTYEIFDGVDFVFHLAAKNCISDCQNDPVGTAQINVVGTVNVFEAARRANVKKVIYAESSAVYEGSSVFPTPEREEKPQSFYATSKMCGMYFAEAYARYYSLNTTALRYFCVYGPRQDYRRTIPPVMSAFIINLLKGISPTIYGTGEKKRDFIYVDDINNFHMMCLENTKTDGKVFNLGSGKNYSVNEVYKIVCRLLDTKICPISKPDLPGEAQATLADITEAKKIGWEPIFSIEDGLRESIAYIKQHVIERL